MISVTVGKPYSLMPPHKQTRESDVSETVKIIEYLPHPHNFHVCIDETGKRRQIDLLTSGDMPNGTMPHSLVGMTASFDYTHPYLEMAEGVAIK
jgi:hypothetical protein